MSPVVALDCSILVGRESHQNRGTQNSALWPPKCLSYKAGVDSSRKWEGVTGCASTAEKAGRGILLIYVNVLLSLSIFWACFQALISLVPRDTQPGFFYNRQASRPGWGPGCHGFRLAES